jgi:hypothetical protein
MGTIKEILSEKNNHLKNNYGYFTDAELEEVVEVATKYHEDNSYDYKANLKDVTLAKLVKNLIIDKEVNKDKYIKQALEEIYLLADMNKDREEIKKTVEENKEEIKSAIQNHIDNEKARREMMEVTLLQKAEEAKDEEEKKRMIDTSKAYTEAYKFENFIKYLQSDEYEKDCNKYRKPKHHKRLDEDCDYIIQKVSIAERGLTFENLRKAMAHTRNFHFAPNEADTFCNALHLYIRRFIKNGYQPDMWYVYEITVNLMNLMNISYVTEFDKEKAKYLIEAFDELGKHHEFKAA